MFVFVVDEEGGGFTELLAFLVAAVFLKAAELVERLLKLAGEARAVERERGERLDDGVRRTVRAGGEIEEASFEERDAAQAPCGVGELLDEEGFSCVGGLIFFLKLPAVLFVGGGIFGAQNGGAGAEAVTERVARGSLLAGFGDGAGGMLRVLAIDGGAA